jgi:HSP20 family molecular chaperone IbpA
MFTLPLVAHRWFDGFFRFFHLSRLFPFFHVQKSTSLSKVDTVVSPVLDIVDSGTEIVLRTAMPGVEPSGLEITIEDGRLTLRGTPGTAKHGHVASHQVPPPHTFERSFALSDAIDESRITVWVSQGVAKVTLPRRVTGSLAQSRVSMMRR